MSPEGRPEGRQGMRGPLATTLRYARGINRRYQLSEALGLRADLDQDGVDIFLARSIVRRTIREVNYNINNPISSVEAFLRGRSTEKLEQSLAGARIVSDQLDNAIEIYMSEYPQGSNRPFHIRDAVNFLVTQSEETPMPRTRWGQRRYFRELASDWRERLAHSQ